MTAIASLQGASIQGWCSAKAVFSRFSHRVGTTHFATIYVSSNYETAGSRSPVFPRGLEPPLFYNADNQTNTESQVPTLL
jgi:hypothetical protein